MDKGGRDSVKVTGPQEEGDGEKVRRSRANVNVNASAPYRPAARACECRAPLVPSGLPVTCARGRGRRSGVCVQVLSAVDGSPR